MGALVGGVNFVVMVTMVILCSVMVKELCRRKKSMARSRPHIVLHNTRTDVS